MNYILKENKTFETTALICSQIIKIVYFPSSYLTLCRNCLFIWLDSKIVEYYGTQVLHLKLVVNTKAKTSANFYSIVMEPGEETTRHLGKGVSKEGQMGWKWLTTPEVEQTKRDTVRNMQANVRMENNLDSNDC